jgi:molybdopterin converting factor small subunit
LIRVRLLGHIKTSIGVDEVEIGEEDLDPALLVKKLRDSCRGKDVGFNEYNTLVLVEDGEAFVPASSKRRLRSGERVVLIPFSHGG